MYYFPFSLPTPFILPNVYLFIFFNFLFTFTFLYVFPPHYTNEGGLAYVSHGCQHFAYWLINIRVHRSSSMPCFNTERQKTRREKPFTFENYYYYTGKFWWTAAVTRCLNSCERRLISWRNRSAVSTRSEIQRRFLALTGP